MTGEWQVLNRKAGDEYSVMVWLKPSQFLLSYATDASAWMSVGVAVDGFGKILRSEWTKLQFYIFFFDVKLGVSYSRKNTGRKCFTRG